MPIESILPSAKNYEARRCVFLLGAGFSAELGTMCMSSIPATGELLSEGYEKFRRVRRFRELFQFIEAYWDVKGDFPSTLHRVNVEDVLELLRQGMQRPEGLGLYQKPWNLPGLYDSANELIYRTLASSALMAQPIKFHLVVQWLLEKFRPESVISLNWDMVVETSLRTVSAPAEPYRYLDILFSYGHLPDYYYEPEKGIQWSRWKDELDEVPLRVLKLHGSMNWAICPDCNRTFVLNQLNLKETWQDEKLKRLRVCPHDRAPLKLNMVPFGWSKDFGRGPYPSIWRKAYEDLSRAERVVVLGLGFRESDFGIRDLVLRALAVHETPPEILVVSRSAKRPEYRERVARVFRRAQCIFYPEMRNLWGEINHDALYDYLSGGGQVGDFEGPNLTI